MYQCGGRHAGRHGLPHQLGNRTSALNLVAVIGIVAVFMMTNIQVALAGRSELGALPEVGSEQIRQMIGLFDGAGFEASRDIGVRFAAEQRVSAMRGS